MFTDCFIANDAQGHDWCGKCTVLLGLLCWTDDMLETVQIQYAIMASILSIYGGTDGAIWL